MARNSGTDPSALREIALKMMEDSGTPLHRQPGTGKAQIYARPDGSTVRLRTSADRVLLVTTDSPDPGARLSVEGTDWLLIVMPKVRRTPGPVEAYLVPTDEAERAIRDSHARWLASGANSNGNTMWNLWFDDDGPDTSNRYAQTWRRYRVRSADGTEPIVESSARTIKHAVEQARKTIADVAGVEPSAVRISIDFGTGDSG